MRAPCGLHCKSGTSAPRPEVAASLSWLTALLAVTVSGLFLLAVTACRPIIPLALTEETELRQLVDDHGDTPDTASPMTPGAPIAGRIERSADVDYFKVAVTPISVRIVAATAGPGDTVVRIEGLDEQSSTARHLDWADLRSPRPKSSPKACSECPRAWGGCGWPQQEAREGRSARSCADLRAMKQCDPADARQAAVHR